MGQQFHRKRGGREAAILGLLLGIAAWAGAALAVPPVVLAQATLGSAAPSRPSADNEPIRLIPLPDPPGEPQGEAPQSSVLPETWPDAGPPRAATMPQPDMTPFSSPTMKVSLPPAPRPAGTRVFLHHSASSETERQRAHRLAEHLTRQGFYIAAIRAVDHDIKAGSVRYFFPEDRRPGEAVVRSLQAFYDEQGIAEPPREPRGFLDYTPKPHDGTIEVWLPNG